MKKALACKEYLQISKQIKTHHLPWRHTVAEYIFHNTFQISQFSGDICIIYYLPFTLQNLKNNSKVDSQMR